MSLEKLKNNLPEFAKDIKLNLSQVLTPGELNIKQILNVALAAAYTVRSKELMLAFTDISLEHLTGEEIAAAKAAATIMSMNNIYYRFAHTIDDPAYQTMPAKLRMNILVNPGTDKLTFELACLAVSAINGCNKCLNAHATQLEKSGCSKLAIQAAVRIASVINATATALDIN